MGGIDELAGLARSDDPEVRGRIAAALGTIGDSADKAQALGVLIDLLADPDRRVRVTAAQSIGDLRDQSALEPLLPLFEEDDPELACAALAAIAQIGGERAFAPVVTRLFDTNDDIRKNAAAAVGALRDPRALEPLLMCLDDQVEWVRANSAWSLGLLDCPEAIEPLIELADSDDTETVRANAVSALGSIGARGRCGAEGSKRALSFVLEVLDDTAEIAKVRIAAMLALAQAFEPLCSSEPGIAQNAFAIIDALASDPDDDLRSSAIWSLGRICEKGLAERIGIADEVLDGVCRKLSAALDDPHEWCARYAAESLARVQGTPPA